MQTKWMMRVATVLLLAAGFVLGAKQETGPAIEWIILFAGEGWYKQQPGAEEVFRGKLEAVQPPQASTLMRNALYRLAGRTIYTGGRKIAALDKLAGLEVELRGKAVDMDLEGQAIREIWPASVRAGK